MPWKRIKIGKKAVGRRIRRRVHTERAAVHSMGEPVDRSKRIFVRLASFVEVFPELEDAIVEFEEKDFLLEARSGTWRLAWQGGLTPCGNPSCRRGGYELDKGIREMLSVGVLLENIKLSCRGDEGSPQGRRIGPRCQRPIEGTLTLRLKASTAQAG